MHLKDNTRKHWLHPPLKLFKYPIKFSSFPPFHKKLTLLILKTMAEVRILRISMEGAEEDEHQVTQVQKNYMD